MIALLQRVTEAWVAVDERRVAEIDRGLLVLLGVEAGDNAEAGSRLLHKILNYRIFPDSAGRMNLALSAIGGGLLLVPQFTLAADTRKGLRPGFSSAAAPQRGRALFEAMAAAARAQHPLVAIGVFGAHMQVGLVNDGPVTFWLQVQADTR